MPRANRSQKRRDEMLPSVARTFAEFGYRRTTTAVLARRCGVQETILYRLWPDKKAMFLASISHVYERSVRTWTEILESPGSGSPAARVLAHETEHHGEFGLYRILFAGLGENEDEEIRAELRATYRRFERWIAARVEEHRGGTGVDGVDSEARAWALIGLGTIANLGRELELLPGVRRRKLIAEVGRLLLEGRIA